MSTFQKKQQIEIKKQLKELRKTLDEFEAQWGCTSQEMFERIQGSSSYAKRLTVAETVWMVEYARYNTLFGLLGAR